MSNDLYWLDEDGKPHRMSGYTPKQFTWRWLWQTTLAKLTRSQATTKPPTD